MKRIRYDTIIRTMRVSYQRIRSESTPALGGKERDFLRPVIVRVRKFFRVKPEFREEGNRDGFIRKVSDTFRQCSVPIIIRNSLKRTVNRSPSAARQRRPSMNMTPFTGKAAVRK